MGILQLLATKNYILVNKKMLKKIGLEETIMLGELCSEYDYWEKSNKVTDGYFFSTIKNVEENTSFGEKKQRRILNRLKEMNIVEIKLMGMPAKRYIKLNEKELLDLLFERKE